MAATVDIGTYPTTFVPYGLHGAAALPDASHSPRKKVNGHADSSRDATDNSALNGFYFRRRRERLNWRALATVSLDKIIKEVGSRIQRHVKGLEGDETDLDAVRSTWIPSRMSWRILLSVILKQKVGV